MTYRYTIKATPREMESLAWIAHRYESADKLYSALSLDDEREIEDIPDNEPVTWSMSEPEAWEFQDALEREDCAGLIPCLNYRSCLGESLIALEIV